MGKVVEVKIGKVSAHYCALSPAAQQNDFRASGRHMWDSTGSSPAFALARPIPVDHHDTARFAHSTERNDMTTLGMVC